MFTMPSEIEVHHVVEDRRSPCTTISTVPPSLVLLPPSGWVRSTCSFLFLFFIFACSDSTLFYKNWNFFCVLRLDYVRNGVRSACSFFFFFSYLLVLIQLYFKNWILFCVLCFVFGLCEKRGQIGLFFFSFFFFSYLLVLIQLYFKN